MIDSNEQLLLSQFQYDLPADRIARFPLAQRDASKLLVYQGGQIQHKTFTQLPDVLPTHSFLVFNNTKVIPARLRFTKPTGAAIELFLLTPFPADLPVGEAMKGTGSARWQAMVGNRKRWKPDETLQTTWAIDGENVTLTVRWYDYNSSIIELSWQPIHVSFAQLIQYAGEVPLPPYLKRDATVADRETYQTVYSSEEGAVAAPTAGLHFTSAVFEALHQRNIQYDYITLHVGAGTFQPIKTDDVRQHSMHTEQVIYTRQNVQNLFDNLQKIIPIGTTSMRGLESLYWMGVKLVRNERNPFHLDQHYAYQLPPDQHPSATDSLQAVLKHMTDTQQESIVAHTSIYITPGYLFKLCKGIVTNFHQPGSTLILLIAALIGDEWKRVYESALQHDYRFLSYGDSSLLLPNFKE